MADFDSVIPGSREASPCSPSIEDDLGFRGLLLTGPSRASLSRNPHPITRHPRVVVCGAYHLQGSYLDMDGRFLDRILLVTARIDRHGVWSAFANNSNEPDLPPTFTSSLAHRSFIGYFNIDLIEQLDVPARPGHYVVYAVLGQYVSNVVSLEIAP